MDTPAKNNLPLLSVVVPASNPEEATLSEVVADLLQFLEIGEIAMSTIADRWDLESIADRLAAEETARSMSPTDPAKGKTEGAEDRICHGHRTDPSSCKDWPTLVMTRRKSPT